jgi:hypothetical protein
MDDLQVLKDRMRNWADDDYDEDLSDLLHCYFEATKLRDWCDIADEARNVWELLFDERLEQFSPVDGLMAAVAAQAAGGIYNAVASALGLNPKFLRYVLSEWEEQVKDDNVPPPITFTELKRRLKQEEKDWENMYGNH